MPIRNITGHKRRDAIRFIAGVNSILVVIALVLGLVKHNLPAGAYLAGMSLLVGVAAVAVAVGATKPEYVDVPDEPVQAPVPPVTPVQPTTPMPIPPDLHIPLPVPVIEMPVSDEVA